MTEVVIAGIGQTPVGEHWNLSLRELTLNAIEAVQQDVQHEYVRFVLSMAACLRCHMGMWGK